MDVSRALGQFVEKLLIHRGVRGLRVHVYPPAQGVRNYSVVLEGDQIWERFYMEARATERFARTGEERFILPGLRAAFRNIDKILARRKLKKSSSV